MAAATALPGVAAVVALIFTYVAVNQTKAQVEISEQGQITDRFNNSIENLGASKVDQRLGGIYALQRIMEDSARDQPSIVQILSAYVRVHGTTPERVPEDGGQTAVDVNAAVEVLARRPAGRDGFSRVDLRRTYLAGIELDEARFAGADLAGAVLDKAGLGRANLSDADLEQMHISHGDLGGADLRRVNAVGTHLVSVNLTGANLAGANLDEANLSWANFTESNLKDANLAGANLCGADLTTATGITVEQLISAELRHSTRLPDNLSKNPRVVAQIARNERSNKDGPDGMLKCY
jgi:hypothetical protein